MFKIVIRFKSACLLTVFSFVVLITLRLYSTNTKQTITQHIKSNQVKNADGEENLIDILNDIFNVSKEQSYVDRKVLLKTIKYMIQEREEDDEELVEFVRSLIVKPSPDRKLNLTNMSRTDFSLNGQSKYMDQLMKSKRNGFFIECGAFDGEYLSNSIFFERERNWTGLLIEPTPSYFHSILAKNRNAYVINACVANKRPIVSEFTVMDVMTGRDKKMNSFYLKGIGLYQTPTRKPTKSYFPCFPLTTILKAINVNHIDYFTLDVEGGEWDVLEAIDLNKIQIDAFIIENKDEAVKEIIKNHLKKFGYSLTKFDNDDLYFMKSKKISSYLWS